MFHRRRERGEGEPWGPAPGGFGGNDDAYLGGERGAGETGLKAKKLGTFQNQTEAVGLGQCV